MLALTTKDKRWLEQHKHQLCKLSAGTKNLRYCGGIQALADMEDRSNRQGSDVYISHSFRLERIERRMSDIPGAPTMPIWQWYRYKVSNGQ